MHVPATGLKPLALFLSGLALGVLLMWMAALIRPSYVLVKEGYAGPVNEPGTAIGFSTEPVGYAEGYSVVGARWRAAGGSWHEWQGASCLKPLTSGQKIRMGVVNAAPIGEAPGGPVVVWFECLDDAGTPIQ